MNNCINLDLKGLHCTGNFKPTFTTKLQIQLAENKKPTLNELNSEKTKEITSHNYPKRTLGRKVKCTNKQTETILQLSSGGSQDIAHIALFLYHIHEAKSGSPNPTNIVLNQQQKLKEKDNNLR